MIGKLLILLYILALPACKKPNSTQIKQLTTALTMEPSTHLKKLQTGQCLIEITENFDAKSRLREQHIGTESLPQCIPVKQPHIQWRGRLDVDIKQGPKRLSLALIVDNSGSLKNTDPHNQRFKSISSLLTFFKQRYANYLGNLRVGIFFFNHCMFKELVFNGGSLDDFEKFQATLEALTLKSQGNTNYISAVQHANKFLNQSPDHARHLILFSDGMPWIKGDALQKSHQCGGLIEQISQNIKTAIKPKLGFNIDCLAESTALPDDNCSETVPAVGLNKHLQLRPWLDPANFLLAMQQHLRYFQNHVIPLQTVFHTVFLNKKPCGELTAVKATPLIAGQFAHLCNEIAPQVFFPGLIGTSKGMLLNVDSSTHLTQAFQDISKVIDMQVTFSEVSFRYQDEQKRVQTKTGQVCLQNKQTFFCPGEGTPGMTDTFADQEAGGYNFQLPFMRYMRSDRIQIDPTPVESEDLELNFFIAYQLQYTDSACPDYKLIHEEQANQHRIKLLQYSLPGKYRITCKTSEFEPAILIKPEITETTIPAAEYPFAAPDRSASETMNNNTQILPTGLPPEQPISGQNLEISVPKLPEARPPVPKPYTQAPETPVLTPKSDNSGSPALGGNSVIFPAIQTYQTYQTYTPGWHGSTSTLPQQTAPENSVIVPNTDLQATFPHSSDQIPATLRSSMEGQVISFE